MEKKVLKGKKVNAKEDKKKEVKKVLKGRKIVLEAKKTECCDCENCHCDEKNESNAITFMGLICLAVVTGLLFYSLATKKANEPYKNMMDLNSYTALVLQKNNDVVSSVYELTVEGDNYRVVAFSELLNNEYYYDEYLVQEKEDKWNYVTTSFKYNETFKEYFKQLGNCKYIKEGSNKTATSCKNVNTFTYQYLTKTGGTDVDDQSALPTVTYEDGYIKEVSHTYSNGVEVVITFSDYNNTKLEIVDSVKDVIE